MATVPNENTGRRLDRPQRPTGANFVGTCDGCRELSARVDRLEESLASRESEAEVALGTTVCYWACVVPHGVVALLTCGNEMVVQFGLLITLSSLPTLVVLQVMAARPLHQRILRSLLAASVVATCAIAGLWLVDAATPNEVIPYLLLLAPSVYFSSWFVAKLIAWNRGWRIVPPGRSIERPRLHIHHLLLFTLLVATYLAAARVVVQDSAMWLGTDLLTTAIVIAFPIMGCTVISCLLARILLAQPPSKIVLKSIALAVAATLVMSMIVVSIILWLSESTVGWGILFATLIYSVPMTAWVFASCVWTFTLMRIAKYRIWIPTPASSGD